MKVLWPHKSPEVAAVTVVIPCYNYGKYLAEVVQSVLSQDRVDVRVIIVDDASTDTSVQIATALARGDSRITLITHSENQGHIATYNDGLARVDTAFVALLSADDLLAPGALARATDLMAAHPRVGMVYGTPIEFEDSQGPSSQSRSSGPSSWTIWTGKGWLEWACRRGRCFILSPEVTMRTRAMQEIGLYNPELPHSGDLEYWLRTAAGWDIGRVNGPAQAYYRVHAHNMHLTTFSTIQVDLLHRLDAFKVLSTQGVAQRLHKAEKLLENAKRGVSREALLLAARNLDSGGRAETSRDLRAVALRAHPDALGTLRNKGLSLRLRRADREQRPAAIQRLLEMYRCQVDRVRWTAWRMVGIS